MNSCQSNCDHMEERKDWPVPVWPLRRTPTNFDHFKTRKAAYPTVAMSNLGQLTYLIVSTFYTHHPAVTVLKWEELSTPLWQHGSQERLTYPTVTNLEAQHPTLTILKMTRFVYLTVATLMRGMPDLSQCGYFSGSASNCNLSKIGLANPTVTIWKRRRAYTSHCEYS